MPCDAFQNCADAPYGHVAAWHMAYGECLGGSNVDADTVKAWVNESAVQLTSSWAT